MGKLVQLFRPGASEHKRTDLAYSYLQFTKAVNEKLGGVSWSEQEKIKEVLTEYDVYKEAKQENNVKREEGLFKKLNLTERTTEVKLTRLGEEYLNSQNDINPDYFMGMDKVQYDFLLIFLLDDYKNGRPAYNIIDNILNHKPINHKISEELNVWLIDNELDKITNTLKKQIDLKSGSPDKTMVTYNGVEYSMKEAKQLIIDYWFDCSLESIDTNIVNIHSCNHIVSLIMHFAKGFNKTINSFCGETLFPLLIDYNLPKKKIQLIINKIKNGESDIGFIPNNINSFIERCIKRIIKGVESSYNCLINNHLRIIDLVKEDENGFYILEEHRIIFQRIIQNYELIVKTFETKGYVEPIEMLDILNLNSIMIENNSFNETYEVYLQEYGTLDKVIQKLELFNFSKDNNSARLDIDEDIRKSKHINGICSAPAYYEFIIGMGLLIKYKNIFELEPKEFCESIKSSLHLKFKSTKLVPYLHAPGGRPDISIVSENGDIIAEPTIQLKNQTSMEADSIKNHLKSYNRDIKKALFISPEIEEDIVFVFEKWKEKSVIPVSIDSLSNEQFIEFLRS